MRPTSIIISVSFRWSQDKTFCLLRLPVIVEQKWLVADFRTTLAWSLWSLHLAWKCFFCKISLNDNRVSGPVGRLSSLLARTDIFTYGIKAAVSSIKFPVVGLLKCISKKKHLRFANQKRGPNPLKLFGEAATALMRKSTQHLTSYLPKTYSSQQIKHPLSVLSGEPRWISSQLRTFVFLYGLTFAAKVRQALKRSHKCYANCHINRFLILTHKRQSQVSWVLCRPGGKG